MIYACLAFLIGILRGNPGALLFGRFHIVYISIFIYLLFGLRNIDGILENSFKAVIFSTAILVIYNSVYIMVGYGIWPESLSINLEFDPIMVWDHSGYLQFYTTNSAMLTFLAPFFVGLFIENRYRGKNKIIIGLIALAASLILFLTGRRAFWLSLIMTIVYFSFFHNNRKNLKSKIVLAFLLVISYILIQSFGIYDVNGIVERFQSAFASSDYGTSVRIIQIKELFNGFLNQPIFGSGAGKGVSYARSAVGYSYEASYSLILYNSGIIGSAFYLMSLIVIISGLYKYKIKKFFYSNSLLIGFISILVANGTNPYLNSSFSFLWVFFLPLLYLDEMRRNKRINRIQ
jgi:hypothetical protein